MLNHIKILDSFPIDDKNVIKVRQKKIISNVLNTNKMKTIIFVRIEIIFNKYSHKKIKIRNKIKRNSINK